MTTSPASPNPPSTGLNQWATKPPSAPTAAQIARPVNGVTLTVVLQVDNP
ncbi:MAG: hypothetical protein ACT6FD_06650 [Methanosarcinaceae archaeon]